MSGMNRGGGFSNDPTTNLVYATYAMAALRDLQVGMAVARNIQMTNQLLQQKLAGRHPARGEDERDHQAAR